MYSNPLRTSYGLGALLVWSTSFAVGRSVTEGLGMYNAAMAIYGIGGLAGVFWLLATGRFRRLVAREKAIPLAVCGFLYVTYITAYFLTLGTATTRAQLLEASLVNYLWPTLTALFSVWLLRVRASWLLLVGLSLATLGVALTLTPDLGQCWTSMRANVTANPRPYGCALYCGISWGLYSVLSRKWAEQVDGKAVFLFSLVTGIVFAGLALAFPHQPHWTPRLMGELAFMVICINAAYLLWGLAIQGGNMMVLVLASFFTPVLSTLLTVLYLHVAPHAGLWVGCGLVVAGSFLCNRAIRVKPGSPTA